MLAMAHVAAQRPLARALKFLSSCVRQLTASCDNFYFEKVARSSRPGRV